MATLGKMYHKGLGVKQDYNKAKRLYEQAVNLNDGGAMNSLGNMYYEGLGVKQDYQKAKEYYEQAIK